MKKYKQLFLGVLIGAILTIPAFSFAEEVIQKVEAVFAQYNFVVNGENKTLDADPLVYQGSTYLPVRTVSNLLGYDVTYKADSRTIELDNTTVVESVYSEENPSVVSTISPTHQINLSNSNFDVSNHYSMMEIIEMHGNIIFDIKDTKLILYLINNDNSRTLLHSDIPFTMYKDRVYITRNNYEVIVLPLLL